MNRFQTKLVLAYLSCTLKRLSNSFFWVRYYINCIQNLYIHNYSFLFLKNTKCTTKAINFYNLQKKKLHYFIYICFQQNFKLLSWAFKKNISTRTFVLNRSSHVTWILTNSHIILLSLQLNFVLFLDIFKKLIINKTIMFCIFYNFKPLFLRQYTNKLFLKTYSIYLSVSLSIVDTFLTQFFNVLNTKRLLKSTTLWSYQREQIIIFVPTISTIIYSSICYVTYLRCFNSFFIGIKGKKKYALQTKDKLNKFLTSFIKLLKINFITRVISLRLLDDAVYLFEFLISILKITNRLLINKKIKTLLYHLLVLNCPISYNGCRFKKTSNII